MHRVIKINNFMTMKNKQKRKKNPRSARPHPRREHQGEHAYLFYLHVAERKDAHSKVCSWYCCDELDLHVAVHLLAVTWPVLVTLSLKDTNKYTLNMCITVSLYPSTIKRKKTFSHLNNVLACHNLTMR